MHPFGWLLPRAYTLARQADFEWRDPPADFSVRQGKGGLELRSGWLAHPRGTQLRSAYLTGPKLEIVVLMGYPAQADRVPVFGLEFVVAAELTRVAVVDLQPAAGAGPLRDEVVADLAPLHESFTTKLSDGGELPEWALKHFTPRCVYARPKDVAEHGVLGMAFEAYLRRWLDYWIGRDGPEPRAIEELADYQDHHVANTPGRPLIRSAFGEAWAEAYFRRFMYSSGDPSRTDSHGIA
jgi:hypothetical protein